MISDEDVKQLFRDIWRARRGLLDTNKPMRTYFSGSWTLWHGRDSIPINACGISRFLKFNIVPKYCFDCFKVVIEPRTVIEPFKLMIVIESLDLTEDNARKRMVETRKQMPGAYKGFMYCRSIPVDPFTSLGLEYEPKKYTADDAEVMPGWLKYAATIGDESYLKICWKLQPFPDIEHTSQLHPVDEE